MSTDVTILIDGQTNLLFKKKKNIDNYNHRVITWYFSWFQKSADLLRVVCCCHKNMAYN